MSGSFRTVILAAFLLSLGATNAVSARPLPPVASSVEDLQAHEVKKREAQNQPSQSTFSYSAYIRGTKTHEAEVTVSKGEGELARYRIWGKAKAVGIAGFISRFKTRFLSLGHLINGRPVADEFELDKTSKKSTRIVRINGDVLNVTRNGVVRPPKKSLAHIDILSAFFMMGGCADTKEFHTGRHGYAMTLLSSEDDARGMRCDYHLIDDDMDEYDGTVWLGERNGFVVPLRFEFDGALSGTIVLKSS